MKISDLNHVDVIGHGSVEGGFDLSGLLSLSAVPQVPTSLGNLVSYVQTIDDPSAISFEGLSQFYLT